ncbi:MAG: hypothetical protein Q8Q02_09170 [Nocardioides sp.]|nr:hypothetical protein [Nocardioides sp.]
MKKSRNTSSPFTPVGYWLAVETLDDERCSHYHRIYLVWPEAEEVPHLVYEKPRASIIAIGTVRTTESQEEVLVEAARLRRVVSAQAESTLQWWWIEPSACENRGRQHPSTVPRVFKTRAILASLE